ncbi:MAG: alpha/beta fold hydrolase [Rhodospirillales bacterium]
MSIHSLFPGFKQDQADVNGVRLNYVIDGNGPPLLLLHGHPQTLAIWHKVAADLSKRYTVVAADLRGYGDSSKPEGLPDHSNYSKRTMANDIVGLMQHLGFESFHLLRP